MPSDEQCMAMAIDCARKAVVRGMRPFGCVISLDGWIIGVGAGSETVLDPTRHSEILAIRQACCFLGRKLEGCTLYSTHEPCFMCTGAILHSHASRVVYGSSREDLSTLFRPYTIGMERWLDSSHPPEVVPGVLRHRCIKLFEQEVLDATRV